MRQDPDIIMVGEIRDLETAEMAVQAALTGHLVLSTLHTNDAPSAIARLIELGVPPYLLNATLNGIMAQRLVRTLCPHCKQTVELNRAEDQEAWDALVAPWKSKHPARLYKPVGCLECRMTGYMGRMGIYETLVYNSALKNLVSKSADLEALREQGFKDGMKPLRISGAMKVGAGITTMDEVLKVAPPVRDAASR
jgi:general secretion pathway protein E